LAHVARLGQRGGVVDRERHVEQARQGLGQQGLARAGRADQQDVRLGQLDVVVLAAALDPLVVVVDRHRERALGPVLPDHVLVQDLEEDRKSTRLNSSHVKISYAVFCLKKKKKNNLTT